MSPPTRTNSATIAAGPASPRGPADGGSWRSASSRSVAGDPHPFQEIGRQRRPPVESRLCVRRGGVLPYGAFAPVGGRRDLLVALPLEQLKGHLPLRRG